MIEVTDEMREAFLDAGTERGYGGQLEDLDAGLAAVLAILERERKTAAERGWDTLRECPSESPAIPVPEGGETTLNCENPAGHDGAHGAMRYLTSWRDQVRVGSAPRSTGELS